MTKSKSWLSKFESVTFTSAPQPSTKTKDPNKNTDSFSGIRHISFPRKDKKEEKRRFKMRCKFTGLGAGHLNFGFLCSCIQAVFTPVQGPFLAQILTICKFRRHVTKRRRACLMLFRWRSCRRNSHRHTSSSFWRALRRTMVEGVEFQTAFQSRTSHLIQSRCAETSLYKFSLIFVTFLPTDGSSFGWILQI